MNEGQDCQRLSWRRFLLVLDAYKPSPFEVFGDDDARFCRSMHFALKNRTRLFAAARAGLSRIPNGPCTVVDFGPFPGTFLRLLRIFRPSRNVRLVGVGLMTGSEFIEFMSADSSVEIYSVNLDRLNKDFRGKGYSETVPLADRSVQVAFALEIIEHLTSPHHLLQEAFRILAPGGYLIATTPNVTRVGNLFKIIIGRSPNDRLSPPGYSCPDDEWRPHVREYSMGELVHMFEEAGFSIKEKRFYLGEDTMDCIKSAQQRLADLAKVPFFLIPHFRGSLLVVGRKPEP